MERKTATLIQKVVNLPQMLFIIDWAIRELDMNETALVIIAIVSALGLVGVVTIGVLMMPQEADAKGCRNSVAANASKGRCIFP